MEVVASLSQGRTAAAQYGLFTHKSVPIIFEPPCKNTNIRHLDRYLNHVFSEYDCRVLPLCHCAQRAFLFYLGGHQSIILKWNLTC